jgi:hypothetical protein
MPGCVFVARFVLFCFQRDECVIRDEAALADHGPEARNGNAAVGNIKKSKTNNRWLSGGPIQASDWKALCYHPERVKDHRICTTGAGFGCVLDV